MLDEIPCNLLRFLKLLGVLWYYNLRYSNSHLTCAYFRQSTPSGPTAPTSCQNNTLHGSLQVSHATLPSLPNPTNKQHTWVNTIFFFFLPEPMQLAFLNMLCYIQFPGIKYHRCLPVHLWFSSKTMGKETCSEMSSVIF